MTTPTDYKARPIRRHPEVAAWRLVAWCLLLGLLVSLVANGALVWVIYEGTRSY